MEKNKLRNDEPVPVEFFKFYFFRGERKTPDPGGRGRSFEINNPPTAQRWRQGISTMADDDDDGHL